ncbi:DNA polymerase III subunit gamma/tau [Candidatus Saccharibacteria bacterium]|nr:DNA polymerase III subunit gamma/tau [Candidatus Saccharibacteria bacterium]
MKALYRKYRPTKLSDVIGQDQVVKPLTASLKSGKISHAYLFTGPRGCGKTSVARIFAHEINHFDYQIEDEYTDIIEIDAASNTGVDNIRELREKACVAPTKGKYKVYIIDEVHMLSKSAFNALLKTLEEPPKSVVFIMATTDAYKVPVTITSRAQNYTFNLATPDIMLKHLENIAKQEKIAIEKPALEVIVKKGGGSFRDTISLLDQISTITSNEIKKADVISILGLPNDDTIKDLLLAYKTGDVAKITQKLKTVLNSGTKPEILAENLISAIIENPEPELLPLLEELPKVSSPFEEAKILLAFLEPAKKIPNFHFNSSLGHNAVTASTTSTASLDWSAYIENAKKSNLIVGNILEKSGYEQIGNELHLYPERKIHISILKSKNNLELLNKFLPPGISVIIENSAKKPQKDDKIDQISDIMGAVQEVNNNGVPF